MKLLGSYGSPFVRRAAVTMNLYGISYEHDAEAHRNGVIDRFNPIGRMPVLVVDDEQIVIDSAAILDYLDHQVGANIALTPLDGDRRTRMISDLALAVGATEKAIQISYEVTRRPLDLCHAAWAEELGRQVKAGFEHLDGQFVGPWMLGERMTQLDVTCAVCWKPMERLLAGFTKRVHVPNIRYLIESTAELKAFQDAEYPSGIVGQTHQNRSEFG